MVDAASACELAITLNWGCPPRILGVLLHRSGFGVGFLSLFAFAFALLLPASLLPLASVGNGSSITLLLGPRTILIGMYGLGHAAIEASLVSWLEGRMLVRAIGAMMATVLDIGKESTQGGVFLLACRRLRRFLLVLGAFALPLGVSGRELCLGVGTLPMGN